MTTLLLDLILHIAAPDHDEEKPEIVSKALDHHSVVAHRIIRDRGLDEDGNAVFRVGVCVLTDTELDEDKIVEGLFENHFDVNLWDFGPEGCRDMFNGSPTPNQLQAYLDEIEDDGQMEEEEDDDEFGGEAVDDDD